MHLLFEIKTVYYLNIMSERLDFFSVKWNERIISHIGHHFINKRKEKNCYIPADERVWKKKNKTSNKRSSREYPLVVSVHLCSGAYSDMAKRTNLMLWRHLHELEFLNNMLINYFKVFATLPLISEVEKNDKSHSTYSFGQKKGKVVSSWSWSMSL